MSLFRRQKKNNFRAILLWLSVAAWLAFIFSLSAQPSFPVNFTVNEYQTISSLAHIALYVILAFLVAEAAAASGVSRRQTLIAALAVCAIYGALDEWHQSFVLGREASLNDWLLDAIAALAVVFFYAFIQRLKLIDR
ncbi:MAG: VanZ family protein [Patescibacteria group bacterium]|jgi:VanZ family protein